MSMNRLQKLAMLSLGIHGDTLRISVLNTVAAAAIRSLNTAKP